MADPKPKLPRLVIVLNVMMIIIVLVICFLTVSLLYSDAVQGEKETSADISISTEKDSTGTKATTVTTTTTPKPSVSMTKRTTDPSDAPIKPADTESTVSEDESSEIVAPVDSYSYDRSFFADDLFIGDSITTGLYLYNKLDMKNVAASVGYTPYKAYTEAVDLYDGTAATALDYAERLQPKRIYIMLGSNGLFAASAMEDSYRTLISKLNAVCPDSVIYCISVSPVTETSSLAASGGITNDMVTEFNSFIKRVCSDEGIRYIDLYSKIIDENGYFLTEYAEADGLHFKGKTYDLMLSYIEECVE